jgi:hypothetical protein
MKLTRSMIGFIVIVLALTGNASAAMRESDDPPVRVFQERIYRGKPIEFWLKVLRDHNDKLMSDAFEAIHSLDQDAWVAVPELTKIVGSPFTAIRVGVDSHETIASKLYDIAVRTEAIDTLAWIGESGAPATAALVQWALTTRVVPGVHRNADEYELFIELVALDAEQKMRVAGAVASFGTDAFPMVARMLTSLDAPKRRLAVAILSQDALPVAAELLRSRTCDERELGLNILKDMELVVSPRLLDELAHQFRENCSKLTKIQ